MHIPVMKEEVVEYLNCRPGRVYVDCTVGEGGHAKEILKRSGPDGVLVGIDQDSRVLEIAEKNLSEYRGRTFFVNSNFFNMDNILKELKIERVDGILFDFGLSSFQMDDPARGFSFDKDGPLDMRMSDKVVRDAGYLVNTLDEKRLRDIIFTYGEERWAKKIANFIIRTRERERIDSTSKLSGIVKRAVPRKAWPAKTHVATRTFQALRIAVNNELDIIRKTMPVAIDLLGSGGRICSISFHSLEDRIVKNVFRDRGRTGNFSVLTSKPVVPSDEEVHSNPRSRSAKMRAGESIEKG